MSYRAKTCLWFLMVFFVAAPVMAAGEAATLVPVKAELLAGTRLVLRSAGCSIDLPGMGWSWMTYEGTSQNFLCANGNMSALFLVSIGQLHGDFTDHQPQSLIDGARQAVAARGGKLANDKFEWIELPGMKKCARVTFTEIENRARKRWRCSTSCRRLRMCR